MSVEKGELELIRRIAEEIGIPVDADVPFGDDMAGVGPPFSRLLLTCDMLMDGVDFRSGEHAWCDIGRKAMAVNLSDCAAMAVRPVAALAAVALENRLAMDDALELMRGLKQMGDEFGCRVIGGDTNSWDSPTVINVTVAAFVPEGRGAIRRDGARPGDRLYVTGPLGGSILGRHLTFRPRVTEALRIAESLRPTAMIDISDGFAMDLGRVLDASRCGAELRMECIERVIHADARTLEQRDGTAALEHALHDGEDFELIVAVPANVDPALCERAALLPVGVCVAGAGISMVRTDGSRSGIEPHGWEHFR